MSLMVIVSAGVGSSGQIFQVELAVAIQGAAGLEGDVLQKLDGVLLIQEGKVRRERLELLLGVVEGFLVPTEVV